jgi:hypothetical protein
MLVNIGGPNKWQSNRMKKLVQVNASVLSIMLKPMHEGFIDLLEEILKILMNKQ